MKKAPAWMDRGASGESVRERPRKLAGPQDVRETILIEDLDTCGEFPGTGQFVNCLHHTVLGFQPVFSLAGADEAPAPVAIPDEQGRQRDMIGFV